MNLYTTTQRAIFRYLACRKGSTMEAIFTAVFFLQGAYQLVLKWREISVKQRSREEASSNQ